MKKLFYSTLITIILAALLVQAAMAQDTYLMFLPPLQPIQPVLENAVKNVMIMHTAELDQALYYVITSVLELPASPGDPNTYTISVLGVDVIEWSLERNVEWAGTIYIYPGIGGELWGDLCNPPELTCNLMLASGAEEISLIDVTNEALGDGGGQFGDLADDYLNGGSSIAAEYVPTDPTLPLLWPHRQGDTATYGILGVHAAGFTGYVGGAFSAIDIVGGEDTGWTENAIYAMQDFLVITICDDGTSQALLGVTDLKQNQPAPNISNYLIYAHLDPSMSYHQGQIFTRGQYIGPLVPGTFSDNCGYASQAANHWHLHLGFPDIGRFTVEDCALDTVTSIWTCADGSTIEPGDSITSSGSGEQAPNITEGNGSNFWDWVVRAFHDVAWNFISVAFPDARSASIGTTLADSAILAIVVAYTLVGSFINLAWPITVITIVMIAEAIKIIPAIIRAIYKLIPMMG